MAQRKKEIENVLLGSSFLIGLLTCGAFFGARKFERKNITKK